MHRWKRSPLKQTNCLERDKAKMDSASCEVNSKTAHLVHFGTLRAEALDEWEREILGYVGGCAEEFLQFCVGWGARCVLLEHSSCSRIALLTVHVSQHGVPPEKILSQELEYKNCTGRCKE